jgi:hypothetical protein
MAVTLLVFAKNDLGPMALMSCSILRVLVVGFSVPVTIKFAEFVNCILLKKSLLTVKSVLFNNTLLIVFVAPVVPPVVPPMVNVFVVSSYAKVIEPLF